MGEIKGRVIEMQCKRKRGRDVTLEDADDLYDECVDLDNMLAKVFKYRELAPGEDFEQLAAFEAWLSKMDLQRFLPRFVERGCADLYELLKLGADRVYEMLQQLGMKKSEALLFMLNYTNILYFDGDPQTFRVVSRELPAWLKDVAPRESKRTKRKRGQRGGITR